MESEKILHGKEQGNVKNSSSTAEPNYTLFRDKGTDENQYRNSKTLSTTINKDDDPFITFHGDKSTSRTFPRAKPEIYEPDFGWPIDDIHSKKHERRRHEPGVCRSITTTTINGGNGILAEWKPTKENLGRIFMSRRSKTPTKVHK